jgi:hypothetical protein
MYANQTEITSDVAMLNTIEHVQARQVNNFIVVGTPEISDGEFIIKSPIEAWHYLTANC